MTKNIFLIGPMGAGKTRIARQLALELNLEFVDIDHAIEEHTGVAISWIFDVEGEAGFRQRERAMLDELTQGNNLVLATGGGVILDPENRRCLKERGLVIYLNTSVSQQLARVAHNQQRPLLQQGDPEKILQALFEKREPLYQELADHVVCTDNCVVQAVVKKIINLLEQDENENAKN